MTLPPVIRHRIVLYQRETAALAEVYNQRGLLVRVDGDGEPSTVTERILNALSSHSSRRG
ncbi:hypothetical protein BH09ACT6_BH09ACT6_06740 [soil metagenome]